MAKRLMILAGMLAMVLAAAVPAFAQQQYTATGVLGKLGPDPSGDPTPRYSITDEETGTPYELISGFVGLEPYVGERVTIQAEAVPGPGAPGEPRLLNVTQVKPAQGGGTTGGGTTGGGTTGGGTTGGGTTAPPPSDNSKKVTQTFELTVKGDPPAGASFFGLLIPPAGSGDGPLGVQLTDPDGDGTYTGSSFVNIPATPVDSPPNPVNHPPTVQIVQGTGVIAPPGADCTLSFNGCMPGDPVSVIKDFGAVPLDQDKTFSAKVNFNKGDQGGTTTPESTTPAGTTTPESTAPPESTTPESSTTPATGTGGSSDNNGGSGSGGSENSVSAGGSSGAGDSGSGSSGSGSSSNGGSGSSNSVGGSSGGSSSSDNGGSGSGGSGGGSLSNVASGVRGLLPSTGGMALGTLGVGALLIGGGLLIRRVTR